MNLSCFNFPEVLLPFNKVTFAANPMRLFPILQVIAETFEQYQNDDPQSHLNPTYRWKFMAADTQTAKGYSPLCLSQNREAANNYCDEWCEKVQR